MLFGCFFESEVCHDNGMYSGIFYAEILRKVEIGEIERVGFLAGSEDRDHAGDFWRGRL